MIRSPAYNAQEQGGFKQAWQDLAEIFCEKQKADYKCNDCDLATLCDQCAGWSILEHDDRKTPSDYLCQITKLRAEKLGILQEK